MGGSRLLRLPVRCCWIATANNPALNVEIVRRTVRIRLDAGTDRPWMRNGFRHPDLAGWTQAHRGDLVAAVLTLARAWIARDRPAGPPRHLGTYESWSKVLGGILHTAGIPGFLANVETFYETTADDELRALHGLVDAWWRVHGNAKVGVRDIWDLIQTESIDLDLGEKSEKSQRTRLGKLLGRMRDRIFDGRRVQNAGTDGRAAVQLYRLVEAQRADVADARGGDDDQPPSADVADFADVFPLARTEN